MPRNVVPQNMKQIVIIGMVGIILMPVTAHGTPQFADQLEVNGTYYEIPWDSPFQSQWDQLSDRVMKRGGVSCTACWRGYFAEWSISNRWLYLQSVSVPEGGPMGFGKVPLTSFDHSWTGLVKATWFTGEISCPILAIGAWRDPYGGVPLLCRVFYISGAACVKMRRSLHDETLMR